MMRKIRPYLMLTVCLAFLLLLTSCALPTDNTDKTWILGNWVQLKGQTLCRFLEFDTDGMVCYFNGDTYPEYSDLGFDYQIEKDALYMGGIGVAITKQNDNQFSDYFSTYYRVGFDPYNFITALKDSNTEKTITCPDVQYFYMHVTSGKTYTISWNSPDYSCELNIEAYNKYGERVNSYYSNTFLAYENGIIYVKVICGSSDLPNGTYQIKYTED